jgi:hypothetical protein
VIDKETAKRLILEALGTPEPLLAEVGDTYAVRESDAFETTYGWVFYCNSRSFLETGSRRYFVRGLGYVVVEKSDGSVHFLGTIYSLTTKLKIYEAKRKPSWIRRLIAKVYIRIDPLLID